MVSCFYHSCDVLLQVVVEGEGPLVGRNLRVLFPPGRECVFVVSGGASFIVLLCPSFSWASALASVHRLRRWCFFLLSSGRKRRKRERRKRARLPLSMSGVRTGSIGGVKFKRRRRNETGKSRKERENYFLSFRVEATLCTLSRLCRGQIPLCTKA